jgi:hypothetical protein
MAITVSARSWFETYEDGKLLSKFQEALTGQSISKRSLQVLTVSSNTKNQDVPLPGGLTTAKWLAIKVENGTLTYSKNTTLAHHRVESSGIVFVNGEYTSLCVSNNTTGASAPTVTVSVEIAG